MPDPRVEDLERAAALHWQAPETEPLGEWRLRAAAGPGILRITAGNYGGNLGPVHLYLHKLLG